MSISSLQMGKQHREGKDSYCISIRDRAGSGVEPRTPGRIRSGTQDTVALGPELFLTIMLFC